MSREDDYSICVNLEELMEKLQSISEDGYTDVKLTINKDFWGSEIAVDAYDSSDDTTIQYGNVSETQFEL